MTTGAGIATITTQTETTDVGPDGKLTGGYRVGFQTTKGVNGTVFVPRASFNVEAVMAAVREQAVILDSLQNSQVT